MLVVVLDNQDFDGMEYRPPSPLKKRNDPAADGSKGPGCLSRSDLDWLDSQANELRQFGCDCQIANCLPEAEALLAEQHFDCVLLDRDIFDGKSHHLMSQSNGSAASMFSRLDVEDRCWWFPADIVREERWEPDSTRFAGPRVQLREILRQLASGTLQNLSQKAAPSTTFTPFAGQGGRNVRFSTHAPDGARDIASK